MIVAILKKKQTNSYVLWTKKLCKNINFRPFSIPYLFAVRKFSQYIILAILWPPSLPKVVLPHTKRTLNWIIQLSNDNWSFIDSLSETHIQLYIVIKNIVLTTKWSKLFTYETSLFSSLAQMFPNFYNNCIDGMHSNRWRWLMINFAATLTVIQPL